MKHLLMAAGVVAVVFAALWLQSSLHQRNLRRQWEKCLESAGRIVQGVREQYPGCEGAVCGVTVETGFRPAGLNQSAITHEDFLDTLDRIDPADTPFSALTKNEVNLQAVDRTWNVDTFPAPKGAVGRADREAVTTGDARDWSASIRKMGNIGQAFSETYGAGWISSRVVNVAGKKSLEDSETDAYMAIKQQIECAMSSTDQYAIYDQGPKLGAVMSGYRALTAYSRRYTGGASGYAIGKPTDLHYAPSGAEITGTLAANHTRTMWRTLALTLRQAALRKTDWTVLCGLSLRQAVCDLTDPHTTTTTATATGTGANVGIAADQVRVNLRNETDNELGAVIDVIRTGNGRFMIAETDWIGQTTTAATGALTTGFATTGWANASGTRQLAAFVNNPYAGLVLARGNVWKCWGVPLYTEQLGKDGGGDTFDAKGLAMLGVKNPILSGTVLFTS